MPIIHEIRMYTPVEKDGEKQLVPQDIQVNLEQIFFIHKNPMEAIQQVMLQLPGPLMTSSAFHSAQLRDSGLVELDSTEGGSCWCNPKYVQFYFTPELGVYVFVFPGGSRLGVKATGAEVAALFGGLQIQI